MAIAVIGFLPPAVVFTFRYQQVKVGSMFFALLNGVSFILGFSLFERNIMEFC